MKVTSGDHPWPEYFLTLIGIAVLIAPAISHCYPLDGEEESGIRRLAGYRNAQERSASLPPGALLGAADIGLSLTLTDAASAEFDGTAPDEQLQSGLEKLLKNRDPSYSAVVIDYTDPKNIRWGAVRPDTRQNPGSVSKILCMLALFDGLARAFPDPDERARVMRESMIYAGDWVIGDTHDVPHFDAESGRNRFAVIQPRDQFYLSEWLDHMISASANGAGSVIWREAMLLRHFGVSYPVSRDESEAFFANTPAKQLAALAQSVITEPLASAGIDGSALVQGKFWTPIAKRRVPQAGASFASPRELAHFLLRLEQGRLVDEWSSLEMKRYLYITKRRYRYVYAPELDNAAAFFKSGSLYKCAPEDNFVCRKYLGNEYNLMNSIAIVETPAGSSSQRRYIVALMSNVLRKNSAWDHSRIAAAIEKLIATGAAQIQERGSEQDISGAGQG